MLYSGGGDVPSPNPTDPLYLATYPLFMAGLVFMVRARVIDVPRHRWLDGFVLVLIVATPGASRRSSCPGPALATGET